jgi:uncharacterized protein
MYDSFGWQVLDRGQCLALLGTATVGRVVYTVRGLPAVQPVRFAVRGDVVLFCVPAVSALFTAVHDTVVAFEADGLYPVPGPGDGWFVTVLGRADETRDPELVGGLPPLAWREPSFAVEDRWIGIPADLVSGRRLGRRGAPSPDRWPAGRGDGQ